jgi:hypothetical protein
MWRSPLAYGQATATRIFLGVSVRLTAVNHREWLSRGPTHAYSCDPGEERHGHDEPGCHCGAEQCAERADRYVLRRRLQRPEGKARVR